MTTNPRVRTQWYLVQVVAIAVLAMASYVAHAAPTVTATAPSGQVTVPAGAAITATIAGGPGNRGDWVGVYAVGVNAQTVPRGSWKWLSTDATGSLPAAGVKAGTVHLVVPTQPGDYEARFFLNNSWNSPAKSTPISVASLQVEVYGVMADCAWPPGTVVMTLSTTGGNGKPVTYAFGAPAPVDLAISGANVVIGPTGITKANCKTVEPFTVNGTQ